MRITDAYWEQRNLGVVCTEIAIEAHDEVADVAAALATLPSGYHVAKTPVARYDVMSALETAGFSFIEGSIRVRHDLKVSEPTGLFKRMVDAVESHTVAADDVDRVANEILRGVFVTDRVFLDPNFSAEQAATRYVNWMRDELGRGGSLHELRVSGRPVAFFVFREDDEHIGYSVLSGLYEAANSPGLGNVVLYTIVAEAARRGLKALSSYISTNNLPVVKTHVEHGFSVTDLHYVYVRMRS